MSGVSTKVRSFDLTCFGRPNEKAYQIGFLDSNPNCSKLMENLENKKGFLLDKTTLLYIYERSMVD
jgi:hypothetical protein